MNAKLETRRVARTAPAAVLLGAMAMGACAPPPDGPNAPSEAAGASGATMATSPAVPAGGAAIEVVRQAATSSDDPEDWENPLIPPEVGTLFEVASGIAAAYTGALDAWGAMQKVQNLLNGTQKPSAMAVAVRGLHDHLRKIQIETSDLVANSFQGLRTANANAAYNASADALTELNAERRETLLNEAEHFSRLAFEQALDESAFLRKIKGQEGLSYDWRVGVPHLLWIIGVRLQVLKVEDTLRPVEGWTMAQRFRPELLRLRDGVVTHLNRVRNGIRYTSTRARDLNTGITGSIEESEAACRCRVTMDDLKHWIWGELPMFELQAMVNLLEATIMSGDDPGFRDFTQGAGGLIRLEANPSMCLSGYRVGQSVTLEPCNPADLGQLWHYDRGTNQVKNRRTEACIIQNGDVWSGLLYTWTCGPGQTKWSWDPWSHVLLSNHGRLKVMELVAGNQSAGTPFSLWPAHHMESQLYLP